MNRREERKRAREPSGALPALKRTRATASSQKEERRMRAAEDEKDDQAVRAKRPRLTKAARGLSDSAEWRRLSPTGLDAEAELRGHEEGRHSAATAAAAPGSASHDMANPAIGSAAAKKRRTETERGLGGFEDVEDAALHQRGASLAGDDPWDEDPFGYIADELAGHQLEATAVEDGAEGHAGAAAEAEPRAAAADEGAAYGRRYWGVIADPVDAADAQGHRLRISGPLIYCDACGRYATRRIGRALKQRCRGTASGSYATRLARMRSGRHPLSGLPIA